MVIALQEYIYGMRRLLILMDNHEPTKGVFTWCVKN